MKKYDTPSAKVADSPSTAMSNFPGQISDALFNAYSVWQEEPGKIQAEALRFFESRLNCDLQIFQRACACRDASEMLSLQLAFMGQLFSDYLEESKKLADLYMTGLNTSLDKLVATKFPYS